MIVPRFASSAIASANFMVRRECTREGDRLRTIGCAFPMTRAPERGNNFIRVRLLLERIPRSLSEECIARFKKEFAVYIVELVFYSIF